jgi:hypothetical protein
MRNYDRSRCGVSRYQHLIAHTTYFLHPNTYTWETKILNDISRTAVTHFLVDMIAHSCNGWHHSSADDELLARAVAELNKSTYPEIRGVVCEAHNNVLKLSGNVPTYFHKQIAQASLIRRLPGRPRIENHLTVDRHSDSSNQSVANRAENAVCRNS